MKVGSKVILVAGILAAGATAWAIWDYAKWRSLGPGGLPPTIDGWLRMTRFRWLAKDGLDIASVIAAVGAEGDLQAWSQFRRRSGARPTVSH